MARLPDADVDLVVTSPPYNLGIGYRKYSDRQDRRSYLNWCTVSGQYLVHSLSNNPEPREGATTSGHVSGATGRMVHQTSRYLVCEDDARSVSRYWKFGHCRQELRRPQIHRLLYRQNLSR